MFLSSLTDVIIEKFFMHTRLTCSCESDTCLMLGSHRLRSSVIAIHPHSLLCASWKRSHSERETEELRRSRTASEAVRRKSGHSGVLRARHLSMHGYTIPVPTDRKPERNRLTKAGSAARKRDASLKQCPSTRLPLSMRRPADEYHLPLTPV